MAEQSDVEGAQECRNDTPAPKDHICGEVADAKLVIEVGHRAEQLRNEEKDQQAPRDSSQDVAFKLAL